MAPSYVTSSFGEHASKLRFFTECPIQWDGKRECLRYKSPVGNGKGQMWHFSMFLTVDTTVAGALSYSVIQAVRSPSDKPYMPLPVALILALLAVLTYYAIVNHVMVTFYGKEAVNGWNKIVKIEGQRENEKESGGMLMIEPHTKLTACLIFVIRNFYMYRFVLIPSELFMQFDAFYYPLRDLHHTYEFNQVVYVFLNVLRVTLLMINVFEICRLLSLVILLFVSVLNLTKSIYSSLLHETGRCFVSKARINGGRTTHPKTQLAMNTFAPFQELEMAPSYVTSSFGEHAAKLGFFSECPIQWGRKREFLLYKSPRENQKVKMWHFNMFLTIDSTMGVAFLYTLIQTLRAPSDTPYMPLPVALILALLGFLTYYVIVNHVMVTVYGKDAVNGWNEILKIEGQLVNGMHIVYSLFPSISAVVAVIVNLTLPLAHGLLDVSTELKRRWSGSMVGEDNKLELKCGRRSFGEHASKLEFYTECPIQWDRKRACLRYKSPAGNGKVKLWHFSMFLTVDIAVPGGLLYTLTKALCSPSNKPYMPLPVALIFALLTVVTYYAIVNHVMVTLYGKDAKSDNPHTTLATTLTYIIRNFHIYPYVLIPSELYMHFDAFYYPLRDICKTYDCNLFTMVVINLLRFTVLMINAFEITRLMSLVILLFISSLNLMKSIFSTLLHESDRCFVSMARINGGITTHVKAQLAMNAFAPFQELGTFFLILIGLVAFVVSNFVTIKLYGSMPLPAYSFFPSVSIVTAIIVNLTLPLAHGLLDVSMELKRRWGASMVSGGSKFKLKCGRRRLRGMRPHCWWAGFGGSKMFRFGEHASKLRFFTECSVQWDGKRECLRFKSPAGNGKVKMWHFSMFLTVDITVAGGLFYTLFHAVRSTLTKPYMPLTDALILALLAVLTYYAIVIHVMVALYGKDAVNGWNEILKIEGQLVRGMHMESDARKTSDDPHSTLATTLTYVIRNFSVYPYLLIPSELYMQFDAFYYPLRDLDRVYEFSQPTMFAINVLRFTILMINALEIARVMSLVILLFISALNLMKSIFSTLLHESDRCFVSMARINSGITTHLKTQLAMNAFAPFQEMGTFFLILMGLVVFVVANFVTLKLYDAMPFPVYSFFPSVSAVTALIVNLTLPLAHGLLDVSTELKRRWGASMVGEGNKLELKCGRRRLKGVQPFCMWAGFGGSKMFRLNKETKVQYFEQVISGTVNLLLSTSKGLAG
ncbi:hypothetical protein Fcan01_24913 [Folsomia candida]|uniref:Uncharacterized protein n=1 Tax=Folsomia candida TaxID=158441 RepID=A0A226D5N5_FOLCA|nr:hypothetical protein Fcan01_24913 [Folsomia candida]